LDAGPASFVMNAQFFVALAWVVLFLLILLRLRRRRRRIGSAGAGTVYDMLNEEKRRAVEIVAEGRAEAQDPEDREGNLPEIEK
jgi:hypothetical protein